MIYGIDAENVEISQGRGTFAFSWGLAIGTENLEEFKEAYSGIIERLKNKYDLDSNRSVYCSYELKKELADEDKAYQFIEEFEEEIQEHIDRVTVIFSYFPGIQQIESYREQTPSSLDVKKFHKRHLGSYYEHICAWQIFSDQKNAEKIIVDGFQGHVTRAWEEIRPNLDKMEMVHKGDQVSEIISTSDLIMEKMENDFETKNIRVGKNEIKDHFNDKAFRINPEYLGTSLLAVLTPIKNKHIPTHKINREPIYMIMRPQTASIGKKELIDSPKGIKLQNNVTENSGSLKFYNSSEDKDKLELESKIVYIEEEGEREASILTKNYGYDIETVKFSDL